MTSKPCGGPSSRSVSTSPELRTPNRVSLPTTTARRAERLDEVLRTNSSGVWLGELAGELDDQHGVEAGASQQRRAAAPSDMTAAGARSG